MIQAGQNIVAIDFVGLINMWAGSSAPTGWLLCQGQAVSRATYASLYSVIGTTYGAGDGSTTFNLPDLRASVPVGAGQRSITETIIETVSYTGIGDEITFASNHRFKSGDYVSITTTGTMFNYLFYTQSATVNVDSSGNIGYSGWTPTVGDKIEVYYQNSTSGWLGTFYIISIGGGTFQVSTTQGGSQYNPADSGLLRYYVWKPQTQPYNAYIVKTASNKIKLTTTYELATAGSQELGADTFITINGQGTGTYSFTVNRSITTSTRVLAEDGGEEEHTLIIEELPRHRHRQSSPNGDLGSWGGSPSSDYEDEIFDLRSDATGSGYPHNNMPPFTVVNFIIKT